MFRRLYPSMRLFLASSLPLFIVAHFAHHVVTAATAPLLPLVRTTFGLSYAQSGLILSAFSLSYGLAHLPAGWLNDRIGSTTLIFLGISGVSAAGLLAGLAPSFPILLLAQLLMGFSGAGYHPSATSLIARGTPPERRGAALGTHIVGGSMSHFIAPLMVGGLAAAWGWRGSFLTLSAPTLVFGLLLFAVLRRRAAIAPPVVAEEAAGTAERRSARFWVHMVSFLVLTTGVGALVGSMTGFIPLLAVDRFGFREEQAAVLMSVVFSGGLWVAPLAGVLSDRLGRLPLLVGACVTAVPAIYLLPRLAGGSGFALYALLVLVGLVIFVRMPVSESYLTSEAPARSRSLLLGVYFLGSSVGGGVFTPLIGAGIDRHGFARSFALLAVILLVVTVAAVVGLVASRPPGGSGEAVSERSAPAPGPGT